MPEKSIPKKGDKAPIFILPDSYGKETSLRDFKGKWVVLYFYPKDNTSGCTIEALDFTALKNDFRKLECEIIGISPDSCKSHEGFMVKHDLGITLLSDTDREILKEYGVWRPKKMYGKEYYGVVRTTFVIDPEGKVVELWENVKVKGHAEDVLEKLSDLQSS